MGVVAGEISVDYSYMIFGGISFYLNDFQRGFSLAQNVDALFFEQGAKLYPEFFICTGTGMRIKYTFVLTGMPGKRKISSKGTVKEQ